ncbi:AP-2 complex subunit mu-like [Amphibalanus amphitrite]|uniref:AP-2 complex subunit mu-like n=1 Tax=Amphibalanus amphitrite TaxID=1232801 RepID=UPI001C92ACC5|nr:AP-2 complex subunit mu-like [Amphibalanus amphitrite]
MLLEVFVVNRKGHIVFKESGIYNKDVNTQHYRQFHNIICSSTDALPYFQHGSTHFYHVQSDGLRWGAAAGRRLAPLQVLCWLTAFRDVVAAICGAASESALRANHLTLRQLATEIVEDGQMMALDAGRLRSLLLSRPCVAAPAQLSSPAAPAPTPAPGGEAQQHVYVDVVESVDCVMTSDGEVQQCEVTGRLEVRTEGTACSRVDVSLAEDVRLLEPDAAAEAHLGPQVHVSRLHPAGSRQSRWLSGPPGRLTLLEYRSAAGLSGPPIPISVRATALRLPGSTDIEVTLRVRLLAAAELRAPSVGVQFRPPAGTSAVSATCAGPGGGAVKFDRQAALVTWTVREMAGQQEASAVLRLAEADVSGPLDSVGPFQLSWEISDLTVTGLRVSGVQLAGVPDGCTRRWVRHAAVSATHTVQPAALAAAGSDR